jgi:hypothetical protein
MSVFERPVGVSGRSGGERIIPFESREEAFAWAQEHLAHQPEVIEREFGDLIADA